MKTVIVGAGAVGGYFGGRLAEAGNPVTFLVRERRKNELFKTGLVVHSIKGDFTIHHPDLAIDAEEIDAPDLAIVALKNYHLEGALPSLHRLVEKGAKILPLLNGMEHMDRLVEALGEANVLGGSCYIESTLNDAGEIVHTSPMQDIVFGALSPSIDQGFLKSVETMVREAGIVVTLSEHILQDMWSKYLFLSTLSGITAATRQPIGIALKDPITRDYLGDFIKEVCTIARTKVELPEDIVEQLMKRMESIKPAMTSSMHRDLEKGQAIELESLHGGLLKMASAAQLATPSVKAIYSLLHPYKDGAPILEG